MRLLLLLMTFEVIPAIDLKGGMVVQLVQGVPGTEMVSIEDSLAVARDFVEQGAKTLHIIDLDGALSGDRRNAPIVEDIIRNFNVRAEVGGGIRDYETARYLLGMGVTRVILGTAAVRDPELVSRLSKDFGPEAVMVSLDSREGKVLVEGWERVVRQEHGRNGGHIRKERCGEYPLHECGCRRASKRREVRTGKDLGLKRRHPGHRVRRHHHAR